MNDVQKLKFYQKGTLTVGNRLVDEAQRNVQASRDRSNSLTSGHRACQGCGEALAPRPIVARGRRAGSFDLPPSDIGRDPLDAVLHFTCPGLPLREFDTT